MLHHGTGIQNLKKMLTLYLNTPSYCQRKVNWDQSFSKKYLNISVFLSWILLYEKLTWKKSESNCKLCLLEPTLTKFDLWHSAQKILNVRLDVTKKRKNLLKIQKGEGQTTKKSKFYLGILKAKRIYFARIN